MSQLVFLPFLSLRCCDVGNACTFTFSAVADASGPVAVSILLVVDAVVVNAAQGQV